MQALKDTSSQGRGTIWYTSRMKLPIRVKTEVIHEPLQWDPSTCVLYVDLKAASDKFSGSATRRDFHRMPEIEPLARPVECHTVEAGQDGRIKMMVAFRTDPCDEQQMSRSSPPSIQKQPIKSALVLRLRKSTLCRAYTWYQGDCYNSCLCVSNGMLANSLLKLDAKGIIAKWLQ